jgi:hypothetical protein
MSESVVVVSARADRGMSSQTAEALFHTTERARERESQVMSGKVHPEGCVCVCVGRSSEKEGTKVRCGLDFGRRTEVAGLTTRRRLALPLW